MRFFLPILFGIFLVGCQSASNAGEPIGKEDMPPPPLKTEAGGGGVTEDRLGVKFYPGAALSGTNEAGDELSANLRTPDAMDKVIAFYEKELGIKGSGDPSTMVRFIGEKVNRTIIVAVANMNGETSISISSKKIS